MVQYTHNAIFNLVLSYNRGSLEDLIKDGAVRVHPVNFKNPILIVIMIEMKLRKNGSLVVVGNWASVR